MKRSVTFTLTTALTIAVAATTGRAAAIANYEFTGGSSASSDVEANSTAGNVTIGGGAANSNWGFSPSTGTAFAPSDTTASSEASAITVNDYFSFIVTPNPTFEMDLVSLTFDTAYNRATASSVPTGVTANYFLRTSVDSFASNVGATFAHAYTDTNHTSGDLTARFVDLSGPAFQNLTTATEFRIYIFDNSTSAARAARIDNAVLNGGLVSIPTPAALPAGLALLACVGLRRRR